MLEKMPQHSSQVVSLCSLIGSIIQCGPRFISGNWLSKLSLFFSKTKKMLLRDEDDILNPKLHIYIKYPRHQMGDRLDKKNKLKRRSKQKS